MSGEKLYKMDCITLSRDYVLKFGGCYILGSTSSSPPDRSEGGR